MATKERNEAPPAFVFKGAVKKIRLATMKQVLVGDRAAIVRVEQVLEAPKSFARYEGQDITVELAGTKAVKAGDEFLSCQQLDFWRQRCRALGQARTSYQSA